MGNGDKWRVIAGLGAMLAGAGLFVGALPAGVGATPNQPAPTTSSSVIEDENPRCEDLGFDFGFRIETPAGDEVPAEGVYEDPDSDLVVTITEVTAGDGGDPALISLETSFPISGVFVKSGPGGILYTSDPPTTVWTDLASPNPSISHIDLCWNEEDTTTTSSSSTTSSSTTSSSTTSSSTTSSSTTSSSTTSSTTSPSTTTTAPGETTSTTALAGVTTTVPGGQLPKTGNNMAPMLTAGAVLLAGGTALIAGTKALRRQ
jgi:LPXTG-motif cell wall-anchored protein